MKKLLLLLPFLFFTLSCEHDEPHRTFTILTFCNVSQYKVMCYFDNIKMCELSPNTSKMINYIPSNFKVSVKFEWYNNDSGKYITNAIEAQQFYTNLDYKFTVYNNYCNIQSVYAY